MQVKVWNDNKYDYTEKFREKNITIKAHSFIMMDRDEAEVFQGTFAGMMKDGDGQPDPRGFKMIRIDLEGVGTEDAADSSVFVCHADGRKFQTQAELDAHEKQYASRVMTDPAAEAEIKRRGRPPKKAQGGVSDTATSRGSGTP